MQTNSAFDSFGHFCEFLFHSLCSICGTHVGWNSRIATESESIECISIVMVNEVELIRPMHPNCLQIQVTRINAFLQNEPMYSLFKCTQHTNVWFHSNLIQIALGPRAALLHGINKVNKKKSKNIFARIHTEYNCRNRFYFYFVQ